MSPLDFTTVLTAVWYSWIILAFLIVNAGVQNNVSGEMLVLTDVIGPVTLSR